MASAWLKYRTATSAMVVGGGLLLGVHNHIHRDDDRTATSVERPTRVATAAAEATSRVRRSVSLIPRTSACDNGRTTVVNRWWSMVQTPRVRIAFAAQSSSESPEQAVTRVVASRLGPPRRTALSPLEAKFVGLARQMQQARSSPDPTQRQNLMDSIVRSKEFQQFVTEMGESFPKGGGDDMTAIEGLPPKNFGFEFLGLKDSEGVAVCLGQLLLGVSPQAFEDMLRNIFSLPEGLLELVRTVVKEQEAKNANFEESVTFGVTNADDEITGDDGDDDDEDDEDEAGNKSSQTSFKLKDLDKRLLPVVESIKSNNAHNYFWLSMFVAGESYRPVLRKLLRELVELIASLPNQTRAIDTEVEAVERMLQLSLHSLGVEAESAKAIGALAGRDDAQSMRALLMWTATIAQATERNPIIGWTQSSIEDLVFAAFRLSPKNGLAVARKFASDPVCDLKFAKRLELLFSEFEAESQKNKPA